MNPVTGYLPVWLSSARHDEYTNILSKHYNDEYFDFEELESIEPVVPDYMHITAKRSGRLVCAYFRKTVHAWNWYTKQVGLHHSLSLMKLE